MNLKKDWRSPKVDVYNSFIEGSGMFANSFIKKGEKLIIFGTCGYTDKVGADKAREKKMLVMQWDDDLYSFEVRGNDDGYFINHSCEPNVWMADAYTLIAKQKIKKGEEITVDYAIWEANEKYVSKWKCKCGSSLCRGRVTGKDWQNKELQRRYKNHFSPLLNKYIKALDKR